MFTKKYFQDRTILFLNIAIIAMTVLNIIQSIIRIDTSRQAAIIRFQKPESLTGYSRADATELYSFALASILFTGVAFFLSAKFFTQKRMMSVLLLALTYLVQVFLFIVSYFIFGKQ